MIQIPFQERVERIVAVFGQLPFESITKDEDKLDRFKKKFPFFGPEDLYRITDSSVFHLAVHPRHTAAYQNLSDFVEWRSSTGEGTSLPAKVFVNEAKFVTAKVDEDGNSYLNRLMLSHFFISEEDALLFVKELSTRKQLSMQPNKFGQTPLMIAAEAGWIKITDRLLRLGASRSAKDIEGRDVIDYLKFAQPEIKVGEVAQRDVFTVELIADMLYRSSNQSDKKRIFKVMNDWLANPYRLTCGTGAEEYLGLNWPTPRGKRKLTPPAPFVFDKLKSPWDPRKIPPL